MVVYAEPLSIAEPLSMALRGTVEATVMRAQRAKPAKWIANDMDKTYTLISRVRGAAYAVEHGSRRYGRSSIELDRLLVEVFNPKLARTKPLDPVTAREIVEQAQYLDEALTDLIARATARQQVLRALAGPHLGGEVWLRQQLATLEAEN